MQMFFLFTFVGLVIPFVGGVVIIVFNLLADDKNKPRQASSYIPFCGVLTEFTLDPLAYLRRQLNSNSHPLDTKGPMDKSLLFTLDLTVRETTCLYSREMIKQWNTVPDISYGHLVFLGGQINDFFHPGYNASLSIYLKQAAMIFNPPKTEKKSIKVDILDKNRTGLEEYLTDQVQLMVDSKEMFDLFTISSFIYWHSLLYVLLGPNVI